ncbi:hypothetical protein [Cognaticolwellia mytili]|uniref:hypothetical protein n=1 Tax=Cognaticolwellia mytili TaxID=1888913 RepID=UPI000A170156|nr:hypothetical protein [Cognaticolwellia mytili]
MYPEKFTASTQYNDWKGTSAADDADEIGMNEWLKKKGHKLDNEFLIGVKVFAGENHGEHKDPVSVEFLLVELAGFDTVEEKFKSTAGPVELKSVRVDMPIIEFLGLFKRFSIGLSRSEMLNGREYIRSN